jgi:transcriptional regulator with XRE-family HTH domain
MKSRMFPALLKYHRGRRGVSQLELAMEAEVSARHVSFVESGRAQPSTEMVLRLLSVLGASLREQNEALTAAGLEPQFPEPPSSGGLAPEVAAAIRQMMAQHEPFPLSVLGLDATVIDANRAATTLFETFAVDPAALTPPLNVFTLFFDPRLWRPFVVDWELVAHAMIARLHRESLVRSERRLSTLVDRLLAFPGVPATWRHPDFSAAFGPTAAFRLKRGDLEVGFLVTMTTFAAPRDVTLVELHIESCFPLDEATRVTCERLAAGGQRDLSSRTS